MDIEFNYALKKISKIPAAKTDILGEGLDQNLIFTFSGKSSLALLLMYYRKIGALKSKVDQLLAPPWMGYWVYMTMHKFCFPTTSFNKNVKGLMVYHQWGFPQDIDYISDFCKSTNLFYFEDCAHAFKSYYSNKRVGTLSDASLFSFAKFFPCVVGGAIYTKDKEIKKFIHEMFKKDMPKLAGAAFKNRIKFDKNQNEANRIELEKFYAVYDKIFQISAVALKSIKHDIQQGALERRKENFELFKAAFSKYDLMEDLFKVDALPWVIPLFFRRNVCEKIVKALSEKKIESGIFHFDINRNMLKPNYQECVGIPCHQGITGDKTAQIINIINKSV